MPSVVNLSACSPKDLWCEVTNMGRGIDVSFDSNPAGNIKAWFLDAARFSDELDSFACYMRELKGKPIYWLSNEDVTWEDLYNFLQTSNAAETPEQYLGLQYPFFRWLVMDNLTNIYGVSRKDLKMLWFGEKITSLAGKVFVITGKLEQGTRDKYVNVIERAGGKVKPSIASGVDYLVTNTPNSGTKKNKDADALGIPKITETKLLEMLKG